MITLDSFHDIAHALSKTKPVYSPNYTWERAQWEKDCIAVANSVCGGQPGVDFRSERRRFLEICGLNQSLPTGE